MERISPPSENMDLGSNEIKQIMFWQFFLCKYYLVNNISLSSNITKYHQISSHIIKYIHISSNIIKYHRMLSNSLTYYQI